MVVKYINQTLKEGLSNSSNNSPDVDKFLVKCCEEKFLDLAVLENKQNGVKRVINNLKDVSNMV